MQFDRYNLNLAGECRVAAELLLRGLFARSLGANVDPYEMPSSQSTMRDGMLVLAYHHFTGQGLREGSRFDPSNEVPQFATRIRSFIDDAQHRGAAG
ncbi:MAG: hypothetical protein L0Z07_03680 [Planctomycetes bacterium]|nr:hypothetical protein [Planctomycetota bacterium]